MLSLNLTRCVTTLKETMNFPSTDRSSITLPKLLASLACLLLLVSPASADKTDWEHDIKEALQTAADEKKDLLIDFTGSDWCHWCIQLTKEVFSDTDFVAKAEQSFVLTELDFPSDRDNQPERIAVQNNEWSERLEIDGFPTVILADSTGRPYAKLGYEPGGPVPYLSLIHI